MNRMNCATICLTLLAASVLSTGVAGAESAETAAASSAQPAALTLRVEGAGGGAGLDAALKIVLVMTVISLAPALLVLLTSFTRIVVVLGFLRQALGTQQAPNNQIIIGLALFLTIVVMAPVLRSVNEEALQPLLRDELTQAEALTRAQVPLKEFMLAQVREKDVALFLDLTDTEAPDTPEPLPMLMVIPR